MATFFEQVLLRLKEQLHLQADKEVAAALGMSPTAFNDRKKRDAFPEDKLLALSVKKPELQLDVTYTLTGLAGRNVDEALGRDPRALMGPNVDEALGLNPRRLMGPNVDASQGRDRGAVMGAAGAAQIPVDDLQAVQDEARLLTAFRAADSAGRAALLLSARAIAALSQQDRRAT